MKQPWQIRAKYLVTMLVMGGTLASIGYAGGTPRPKMPPQTPGVTLVTCAPRIDGVDGYLCVEQRPKSPKAVAFTYLVKTDNGLFGARIPERR